MRQTAAIVLVPSEQWPVMVYALVLSPGVCRYERMQVGKDMARVIRRLLCHGLT